LGLVKAGAEVEAKVANKKGGAIMAKRTSKRWIQKAIKRPGAFTKKAKAAGMTVRQYAKHVLRKGSKASTRTKRQAALALTLSKLSKRKKKGK